MNCRESQQQLSAYVDGELDAERFAGLEVHLAQCPGCQQHLDELQQVARGVAALPQLPVPPGFLAEVQRRLHPAASPEQASWLPPWWSRVRVPALATLAAVACILWLSQQPRRQPAQNLQATLTAKSSGPQIVLEPSSTDVTAESAMQGKIAADIAPASQVQSRGWVISEQLQLPDHAAETVKRLADNRLGGEPPTERLAQPTLDAEKARIAAGRTVSKPTMATLELVGADTTLVQAAASQVAGRLGGSTSRLMQSADGRMSFLHVEVPLSQLTAFQQQFDRQFALLMDKNLSGSAGPARASATLPAEPPTSLAGGTRLGFDGPKPANATIIDGVQQAGRGLVGLSGSNENIGSATAPGGPMVILEIQVRTSQR